MKKNNNIMMGLLNIKKENKNVLKIFKKLNNSNHIN